VNTDIFDDVQALKEEIVTLSTSYWTTTQEHRDDISQNRQDISSNLRKITDINNNRITAIEQDITDISNNRITSIEQDITDISNNRITVLAIEQDITDLSDNRGSIGAVTYEAKKKGKIRFVIYIAGERTFFFIYDVIVKQKIKKRPANHYSRRSRRSLSLTAAASGPGLKGLGWCEATDMCLIQGSCCRILLQDPVELAGFCWAVTFLAHAGGVLYGMELGSVTLKINTQNTQAPTRVIWHVIHNKCTLM
jgi:hypothetical protein